MGRTALLALIGLLGASTSVAAQDVMLRSDLPLWTGAEGEDFYPTNFSDADSFGCISNIRFGDYREVQVQDPDRVGWWRIGNYGVFHCALLLSQASERAELDTGFRDHAWVIVLDKVQTPAGEIELLALQIGARGGSDYTLLSRPTADEPGRLMAVLDPVCPRHSRRQGRGPDVWRTDYCAVASQSAMRRIARDAFRRPPVAVLEYVEPEPDRGTSEE